MTGGTNRKPQDARSLIERAAQVYDFNAALKAPIATDAAAPAPAPVATIDPAWRAAPFDGREGKVALDELRDGGFIVPDAAVSAIAEEFRLVKRQLLLDAAGITHGRMILVCSALSGEGKTFCSVNLALSMAAEHDIEVLLVDADFAKPSILSTLGLEGGPGLIDALADPAIPVESCVIRTDVPRLSVLPSGRRTNDATELLASDRTKAVLEGLLAADPRRIIIFDSPPALAASPASVLALHAGQTLLVVRADATAEADVQEAASLLSGCATIRLLLNRLDQPSRGHRFGSYYGHGD